MSMLKNTQTLTNGCVAKKTNKVKKKQWICRKILKFKPIFQKILKILITLMNFKIYQSYQNFEYFVNTQMDLSQSTQIKKVNLS